MFDPTGMAPVDWLERLATGQDARNWAVVRVLGPLHTISRNPEIVEISGFGRIAVPRTKKAPAPCAGALVFRPVTQTGFTDRRRTPKTPAIASPAKASEPGSGTEPPGGGATGFKVATKFSLKLSSP